MKHLLFSALLISALPALADLQTDMINDRLDRLDREMTLMQKKVYTPETRHVTGTTDNGGDLSELYAQLDEQNRVIAELTEKIEALGYAQENLKQQLDLVREDWDVRFQDKAPAPQPEQPKEQPAPPQKASDKEAYDNAYALLVKTKYPEAEQAFTAFLKDYPDSKFVGNANYWLGETYYVRGQYDVAAGIFSDGLTKYESSPKAPDNLLKLGLTMAKLDKKKEACGFLTLLPQKYSHANQTLKQRAEQEAKKLSCP